MLIIAGMQADDISPEPRTPESANSAHGLAATGFAFASSLCFLAATRR